MAYDPVTLDRFQEYFPDIDATDEVIDASLTAAMRSVDESWEEDDYERAVLYLAAHFVTTSAVAATTGADDEISSLTIGPLSLTFKERASLSSLESTPYGQEYARLLRLNVPMVAVI